MRTPLVHPGPRGDAGRQAGARVAWHRQTLFWLGASIVAASLAGCAWLIVMAVRHPDPPLDGVGPQILRMPLQAATPRAPGAAR